MRRNVKVLAIYATLGLLIAIAFISENSNSGDFYRLITNTQHYFRQHNATIKKTNDNQPSSPTAKEPFIVNGTKPNVEERLTTEKYGVKNITVLRETYPAVDEPLSTSGGYGVYPKEQQVPFDDQEYRVVPLSDAAPRITLKEMPKEFYHTDEGVDLKNTSLKTILVWNEAYGTKTMGFGFGREPFQLAKCEVDSCFLTGNRSMLPIQDFDAVQFHFRGLVRDQMPKIRRIKQRWIFEEVESSSYIYQDIRKYNNLFNWTFTYRRDSDVVFTYGRVFARETQKTTKIRRNYAEGKTKMAAWFVSNCRSHSRREKFVKALQKHFKVDVFGKCGPLKCPHKIGNLCYKMLEDDYKFYLSFENSLCKDYVTEKLFNILKYNVVPVVYGLADYDKIAPPGSYINGLQFVDVQSLAKYLQYLDSNDTAYNEYFRWKGHYHIDNGWSNTAQPYCELCKKLHQDSSIKVYSDMEDWFAKKGKCKTLRTKDWLKNL